MKDEGYTDVVLPRMTVCADINNGTIVNQKVLNVVESNEEDEIIEMLIGYINIL